MTELYLIAHKVRGEPAFDVAERMPELDDDTGKAWIIPTSGHRAYPYWSEPLPAYHDPDHPGKYLPIDWPDHYSVQMARDEARLRDDGKGKSLLASLGLLKPAEPMQRRI